MSNRNKPQTTISMRWNCPTVSPLTTQACETRTMIKGTGHLSRITKGCTKTTVDRDRRVCRDTGSGQKGCRYSCDRDFCNVALSPGTNAPRWYTMELSCLRHQWHPVRGLDLLMGTYGIASLTQRRRRTRFPRGRETPLWATLKIPAFPWWPTTS